MKVMNVTLVTGEGGLGGTSRLWRLSVVFTFLFLVMYIIGFSTDWWCHLDNEDYTPIAGATIKGNFGLWRKCVTISVNGSGKISDGCKDMDNDDAYKPAAKTLCSVGLILCILGLPISALAGCSQSQRAMVFGATITLIGGVVAVIGSAVYVGKAKDEDDRLEVDYSSILAMIGAVFLAVGGLFQLLTVRKEYQTLA